MDELLGTVKLVAFNYAPNGYLPCDGRLLNVHDETAIYALIGTTYGGDGLHNFALPKLEAPLQGMHYVICMRGYWPDRP